MATKRKVIRRKSVAPARSLPEQPYNYPYPPPAQSNKILYGILLLNLLFTGFLFYKLQLAKPAAASNTAPSANAQATGESATALSIDNLKKYAKDMKLDTNKFNKCLDNHETKDAVAKEAQEAGSLGVNGTPGFFVNGRFLAGAFPFENFKEIIDKELAGQSDGTCDVYSDSLKSLCSTTGNNGFNPTQKTIDLTGANVTGPENAKVTLVEFSDFQCPFCQRAYPTVKKIMSTYPNDVKLYYLHLPLTQLHPFAQQSAEAAECAHVQGKFWQYHDKLFESQGASASTNS